MKHCDEKMDFTVLGERGQVVIPKDIRDGMGLKAGERLLVFYADHHAAVVLVRVEQMQKMVKKISSKIRNVTKKMKL
ncbi:MAG: AbrB/MazE/SpoVT family DNA-binding domain-containing protein [Patescibacteria group bacterium]